MELWREWPTNLAGVFGTYAQKSTWCSMWCFQDAFLHNLSWIQDLCSLVFEQISPIQGFQWNISWWILTACGCWTHTVCISTFWLPSPGLLWGVNAFAIKALAVGQTRTWLDECLEVHGIALIHKGFALERWVGCYFPTDGNGTVLVRYEVIRLA